MVAAGLLTAIPLYCFAVKSNDFTKASTSFSRKYQTEESRFGERRSKMQDMKADSKVFSPKVDTSRYQGRESYLKDNEEAKYRFDKEAPDASKKYDAEMYKGNTDKWRHGDEKAHLDNYDVNMTRQYKGKIDLFKRDIKKQKLIDEYYSTIYQRSMEEINKFYSRSSRGSSGADTVKKAGAQIGGESDDDWDFFDFLSSKQKIERTPVMFKGREWTREELKGRNAASLPPSEAAPKNAPESSVPVLQKAAVLPPRGKPMQRLNSPVLSEELIDPEQAKKLQFLKVPDEMRSKATIKVQIKED